MGTPPYERVRIESAILEERVYRKVIPGYLLIQIFFMPRGRTNPEIIEGFKLSRKKGYDNVLE